MGNWHCIPSSCSEVVYQEYLSPVVRWRYPGENWQEIVADNYLINSNPGQCHVLYFIYLNQVFRGSSAVRQYGLFYGKIQSIKFRNLANGAIDKRYIDIYGGTQSNPNANVLVAAISPGGGFAWDSFTVNKIERGDGQLDNCGGCIFTIIKNGVVIYTETRSVCPEVEKLPCRLNPVIKRIEIEKLPYLERIEVRNQSINTVFISPLQAPLIDTKPLPSHCLNVYQTYILAAPLLSDFVPLPGFINPYQFVAQICSYPGCPPPQYQVLCDSCGCESCPDGTCPIECDDHICCYNDYGVSVKSIAISNYCGGTT